jgi:hypothetical protein
MAKPRQWSSSLATDQAGSARVGHIGLGALSRWSAQEQCVFNKREEAKGEAAALEH